MSFVFALVVIAAVVALSLRRGLFLVAALLPSRLQPRSTAPPGVSVLVPAHNEGRVARRLLEALAKLQYPPDQLSFVLICDGCSDKTPTLFHAWADQRSDTRVLELPHRVGKAGALNMGFRLAKAEVIVVVDADLTPQPDFLTKLVQPFADPAIGAAAAYLEPVNADVNIITRYAAITSWVHQLVTSAGIDRLGLSPPTFGAAALRRSALEHIGGFPELRAGEDVATSACLIHRGWRTRFVTDARAGNTVESSLRGYWRQHVRWARAASQIAASNRSQPMASWPQRLEMASSSISYGDRLVFATAVAGALTGTLSGWVPALYLVVPGLEIMAASLKADVRGALPRFLLAVPLLFAVDLIASISAVVVQILHRPLRWHNPRWVPGNGDLHK